MVRTTHLLSMRGKGAGAAATSGEAASAATMEAENFIVCGEK